MAELTKIGMTELVGMLESQDPDLRKLAAATIGAAAVAVCPFKVNLPAEPDLVEMPFEVVEVGKGAAASGIRSLVGKVRDPSAEVRSCVAFSLRLVRSEVVSES